MPGPVKLGLVGALTLVLILGPLGAPAETPEATRSWTTGADALTSQAVRLARRAARGDGVALAELLRLWNLAELLDRPEALRPTLLQLAGSRDVDALTRDHARLMLAMLEHAAGSAAEARRLSDEAGVLTEAFIIGPFDNAAGGGHDAVYAPELGLDLSAVERGKNHPVSWRHGAQMGPLGVFHLSDLLRPETEATAYLLYTVEASARTAAALRIGASDRVKVFLDGKEIFSADLLRRAAWDQEAIPVVLTPGPHSILVKVSYTEARGELRARITSPSGGRAGALRFGTDAKSVEAARAQWGRGQRARHRVRGVEDALNRALASSKDEAASELLSLRSDLRAVLSLYDERKVPSPPEVDLERALELGPPKAIDRFFLAHRLEARDASRAREQLDLALLAAPDHVPSLWKLALAHARVHRSASARALLEQALSLDPSFGPAAAALIELDDENRFRARLAPSRLRRYAELAASPRLLADLAARLLAAGVRVEAVTTAEAALRLEPGQLAAQRVLFGAAVEAGDLALAEKHLEHEIARRPWRITPRLELVRVRIARSGSPETGLQDLEALRPLFPDVAEIEDFLAEIHQRKGRTQLAIAALEQSLLLDPQRPEVRRHKDALAGVSSQLEDAYSIDPKKVASLPVSPEERAAGGGVLADRTAVRLYDNGQATRFRQTITRLSGSKLRDALRRDRIYYSPSREVVEVLTAERIRPSGVVEKAARITDSGPSGKVSGMYVDVQSKNIQFQDLEPGDLVHIRYRIDSIGSNIFGGFFGDVSGLSGALPKRNVYYVAESPIERPLYAAHQHAPAPHVETRGKTQYTEWKITAVPAMEPEPAGPPYAELAATLSVSTYRSWEDLADWYARLFREQLELDADARREAHRVVRGAKDDLEKVKRLYSYVLENTRYVGIELGIHGWKPFKASEVHRRRYGDCKDKATLLAALLLEVGVDATITLIRTVDRGRFLEGHASMWAFNHAITYVPSANLFLDGTAEYSGSGELPWQDQGGTALIVFPDGRSQLLSPPESSPEANLNSSEYSAKLRPDGSLELSGLERFQGARASALRGEMAEPERRREQVEQQLNQILPGARVEDLAFSDLSNLEAEVHYRYRVEAPRYGKVEAGGLVLPATLFQHRVADSYAVLAERKTDLVVEHAWRTRNRVRYELPPGQKIIELPTSVVIDSEYLKLEQTIERTDGGFVTDDTVTFKKKRVPHAAYPDFRRAALEIDRALGRRVVLSR